MGSVGNGNRNTTSQPDFSQGYENSTNHLQSWYRNTQELIDDGFKAVNDFSLSALLKEGNIVASDNRPEYSRVDYFIWDSDWKRWMKAAERRY